MANVNAGFRGSIVNIASITVEGRGAGTVVKYRALFTDAEGLVHAHVQHEKEVSEDPAFREVLQQLRDLCRRDAENTHFASPASPITTKKALASGIAEAVSGQLDLADEPGEAG